MKLQTGLDTRPTRHIYNTTTAPETHITMQKRGQIDCHIQKNRETVMRWGLSAVSENIIIKSHQYDCPKVS